MIGILITLQIKSWKKYTKDIKLEKDYYTRFKLELKENIRKPDAYEIELQKFRKWLLQKRLSKNTVNTYLDVTTVYIKYALLKRADIFSTKIVEAFSYDYIFVPNKSVSYQNQFISGIKSFLNIKVILTETYI